VLVAHGHNTGFQFVQGDVVVFHEGGHAGGFEAAYRGGDLGAAVRRKPERTRMARHAPMTY